MMLITTNKLTGPALDWAVAKCEGVEVVKCQESPSLFYGDGFDKYHPSTNWSQAGPIIEKNISIVFRKNNGDWGAVFNNEQGVQPVGEVGSTPLIAAMRCYVASKLGEEVDVPEELV